MRRSLSMRIQLSDTMQTPITAAEPGDQVKVLILLARDKWSQCQLWGATVEFCLKWQG
jgi:hypothetical protein